MKIIYLIFLLVFSHVAVFSQVTQSETSRLNWQIFKTVTADKLISEHKQKLGLTKRDALERRSKKVDDLMIEHTRYDQTHKGVAIDGSQYVLHSKGDELWGNGRLVYGITANENPAVSKESALENALAWLGAESYYWEDPAQEAMIKWLKDDPDATFYPNGKLVFADEQFSQNGADYKLYWKFDIYAAGSRMREFVYVNAMTGMVDYSRDAICYGSAEGIADTYYYGQQTIITDSLGPNLFRLADTTRGGGVYTMDLQLTPPSFGAGVQIEDADNIWNSADKAGPTAHWCAEMTYDFYLNRYNRNSFDDAGAKMLTYVHLGIFGNTCIGGGFFSGLYAGIGDGPGCSNPGYYLEHIGHEFTHGVTAYSSGLQGGLIAGALNESFCNIMGTAIEFYADSANATWQFKATQTYDMSNPNANSYPDTYLGNFWRPTTVSVAEFTHVNSAVQDYWYYLLSEGGSGTNDNGDAYAVTGIGIENATDIVYRNLTQYLVPATTYIDAREGSIQAAIDLFGACSNEVVQVNNAWHAVGLGLGPNLYSNDLSLESIVSPAKNCALTNNEIVEVELKYHTTGCNGLLQVGTSVDISYQVNNDPPVLETWTVAVPLQEGDSYFHSFASPITLPPAGNVIELSVWLDYTVDGLTFNDQILDYEIGLKQVLTDTMITFEPGTDPEKYYYVNTGEIAVTEITAVAANSSSRGFSMSSGKSSPGVISNDSTQNFVIQKEKVSEICFCVDAQLWNNVTVKFDMKQTRSMTYNHFYGTDSAEYVSSARMLVNGVQFGPQFHPLTSLNDPYQTHIYSLDQLGLAGNLFEFCFQSMNSVNDVGDNSPFLPYDSDGDNTYLDNILFNDQVVIGFNDLESLQFQVSPNPADAFITIAGNIKGALQYEVYSILGKKVMQGKVSQENTQIDISKLSPNLYFLRIGQATYKILKTE